MIKFLDKPNEDSELFSILTPIVKKWFKKKFDNFCVPQKYAIMPIHSRENILVSSPTGSGKCITPDSTILLNTDEETKLLTGDELISLCKSRKLISKVDKSGQLYEIPHLESYSLENNQIKKTKALVYFEDYKGKIFKIKTEYGREIRLSPDHPLLVEKTSKEEWVPVKNIKKGDKIAAPIKIDLPEKDISLDYKKAIRNLRKNADIVITYDDFLRLKRITANFTDFTNLDSKELYEIKTLLKSSFKELSKDLSLGITTIFRLFTKDTKYQKDNMLDLLKNRCKNIRFEENRIIFKNKGNQTFSFTYPSKIDIALARWVAFVLAEGLIGDYEKGTHLLVSQKNRTDLLSEFLKNTKKIFDIDFKQKNQKDYAIHSTLFCYFLNDLIGTNRGRGRYVPLPNWILNTKKEIKANFLNVFFSLEACISHGREIIISQSNKNKIEVINYLLSSFGIFSSIAKKIRWATNTKNKTKREYYYLTISKIRNLRLFLNNIGIDHPNKRFLEKQISKKSSGEYVLKHKFDYKKITALSKLYGDYKEFQKDLKNIHEVIRRTGYATEIALRNLKNKLLKFKNDSLAQNLISYIDKKLDKNICWLKINKIEIEDYDGQLVDLTVPDIHNFIGGYGGIYLHNTLTAFLSILNELVDSAEKEILEDNVHCIYISPLKALNNDIQKNLVEPLKEMEELAGKKLNIRVAVRTGDTTPAEKSAMLKNPPHILITTPESIAILLSSAKFIDHLKDVQWCILDEIHALAENKRGVHLSLSLERLAKLSSHMARVGLSATISPLEDVARFLVGYENRKERNCRIVDVQFLKKMDLKVLSPVPDLIDMEHSSMHNAMYSLIDKLIQDHKTTLIFTNTRSATERVVHHLKEKFPKNYTENIGAHHGSLSKTHRYNIEKRLREGKLKAVVCSTSLELGIDIGYIDLVICLGSPKSVARALQRIGRSGHRLQDTTKGRIIVLDRDDLVECAVLLKAAVEKKIDKIHIPTNCLDVLAQHIFGIAIQDKIHINDLFELIKKSYCYKNLDRKDFMEVIDYLAGKYISLEDRHIYAKIWHDEETGMIGRRGRLARVLYMTNIGTIPDETSVKVKVNDQIVGTIEEAFLERLKPGDVFVLGGQVYQFKFSRGMVAQVSASANRPPTVPSWFSEMLPLSFDLALEIGRFRRLMNERFCSGKNKKEILDFINKFLYVDDNAANSIYNYFYEQFNFATIPSNTRIIIEHYSDDKRKHVIFHSLYGRRVNDCLSRAVAFAIARTQHKDVEIGISDNGFYIASEKLINVMHAFRLLKSKDFRKVLNMAVDRSEVLKRRFRHCATRALMILRNYLGRKKSAGRQQVSSMILMSAVKRINLDFFILKESRREVLEDLMDIENAKKVLKGIEDGKIKIEEIHTNIPSPFAFSLIAQGVLDIMKIEDRIEFIRRMHKNVLAKINLKKK